MQSTLRPPVGVCLRDVLPQARVFGDVYVHAESCTTDADAVRPGDIYFAVNAMEGEGAAQAAAAVNHGAKAVVSDGYLPIFGVPQFVVADAAEAYGKFCQALVGDPSQDLSVCGVVAAHGKTTISRLLAGILRVAGKHGSRLVNSGAAPGAEQIARWLGECSAAGCEHAVAELSTQSILKRTHAGAKLGLLCLAGLNFDRSGGLSPDAERRAAQELIDDLPPFSTLVASADDPHCAKALAERIGLTLSYGFDKPADISGLVLSRDSAGQELMVTMAGETVVVGLSHVGQALAQDCLAAMASAIALGVSLSDAARGVESVVQLPGVMQALPSGQSFPIYLDQAASPERLRGSLNAIRNGSGRVIVVLPEHPSASLCGVATALADLVIAPHDRDPEAEQESSMRWVEDRFSALALAVALAETEDVVLLAGAARDADSRRGEEDLVRQLVELRLANTQEPAAM